ncbi:MAG TPA: PTS sugar transporter subunit IIA [Thermoanaerobaculia bacterium]|jgi:PTS system nitrogen regulatory IIA component|nr:PTS sugar transporter subunit IIA [Thermoanaerobaculia bacterium]
MRLATLTRPELIFPDLGRGGRSQQNVLDELAARVAAAGAVRDARELSARLAEREALGSTGVGGGVAIPHCKLKDLPRAILAIGIAGDGIEFRAVDGLPVQLFFLVVSPSQSPAEHLQVLAAISRWVRAPGRIAKVLAAGSPEAIFALLEGEP